MIMRQIPKFAFFCTLLVLHFKVFRVEIQSRYLGDTNVYVKVHNDNMKRELLSAVWSTKNICLTIKLWAILKGTVNASKGFS